MRHEMRCQASDERDETWDEAGGRTHRIEAGADGIGFARQVDDQRLACCACTSPVPCSQFSLENSAYL